MKRFFLLKRLGTVTLANGIGCTVAAVTLGMVIGVVIATAGGAPIAAAVALNATASGS